MTIITEMKGWHIERVETTLTFTNAAETVVGSNNPLVRPGAFLFGHAEALTMANNDVRELMGEKALLDQATSAITLGSQITGVILISAKAAGADAGDITYEIIVAIRD